MIVRRSALTAAILLCCAAALPAQTRTPDWSGQWEIVGGAPNASGGFEDSLDQVLKEMQWGPPNKPQVQATVNLIVAAEQKYYDAIHHGADAPAQPGLRPNCTFGFPTVMIDSPLMFEIVASPKETVLMYSDRENRHVYTDGRAHTPKDELWATPWGDSIGHWEGQTLVIDTIAVRSSFPNTTPEFTPILAMGGESGDAAVVTYLSSQARFIERIRMVDKDHLENQMTIIDPVNFTEPWHLTRTYRRVANIHRMIYEDCEGEDRNPVVNGRYTLAPPPPPAPMPQQTPGPKEHKEVAVDPKLFDGYVGSYQFAPNFVLTVTREGDHLFGQATGQPKFELFAEGDRDYFLKVVDAQITFVTDSNGRATELVLHQNGFDQHAKRAE